MSRIFKAGLIGTVITAICCFTPVLVWLFAALGIASAVAYIDTILFPLLGAFVGLTIFAWRRRTEGT